MGYRNVCCRCPEAWENFINRWAYIILGDDEGGLFDAEWQLIQVQETYLVFRRPVVDLGGWQRVVIPCGRIVALVEAPEPPIPVNNLRR
ncbi:MAG TPA: hypothetical protein VJZ70_02260 [Limnochordia bacterium]|nr:hypothetical protein [Limnochordia bacterium]